MGDSRPAWLSYYKPVPLRKDLSNPTYRRRQEREERHQAWSKLITYGFRVKADIVTLALGMCICWFR